MMVDTCKNARSGRDRKSKGFGHIAPDRFYGPFSFPNDSERNVCQILYLTCYEMHNSALDG